MAQLPRLRDLFRAWVGIGLQSFGGGATTLYLMRRVTVEEQHWLNDEEFALYWGIVQIAPGINLLGQTVLIGWRVAGVLGAIVALIGLLLPSIAITILITAAYATIRTQPLVVAALHGIIPATVGVGVILAIQMLNPPLVASSREGWGQLGVSVAVLVGAPLLLVLLNLPAIMVLWGAGICCAVGFWLLNRRGGAQ
ncbi:MAG: chromate transporter [Chloroflexia bacterium]|nr:chromate transporter [Chloroflexia bacterium]